MTNIGILGAAGIAAGALIVPVRRRTDATVTAVASRTAAADFAERHGIDRAYESYDELLADPGIDLVYNALPPSVHAQWTIAALRAGKDVLCEKPFTMTAAQAQRVADAADESGRRAVEAFHDHYHPLSAWIRATMARGELGPIRRVEAVFTGSNRYEPGTLRHEPELGGGALMDLGCYPVHWVRSLFSGPPTVVSATADRNPSGADVSIEAELAFTDIASVVVRASMVEGVALASSLFIEGERGHLFVNNIVFPSAGHSIEYRLDAVPRVFTVAGRQTYDHQLDAVLQALRTGAPLPTEGSDPVGNMAVIDAIYRAAGFERPWT